MIDAQHGLLGVLVDVLPTGANDVLVVCPPTAGKQELMIPALKSVVQKIDLTARKIYVVLPAGLKELYDEL